MKKWILVCFVIQAMLTVKAQAAVTLTADGLLGGLTKYDLNDYENLYDSNGNLVTSRVAQAGDTLQGVFVINSVSNQYGTANYSPQNGSVELTGVFDELVQSIDSNGNVVLVPDTTTVTSGGSMGKAMSGAQFQATYGAGSMIAVFQNSTNAMNIGVQGYGLQGLTTAQAMALATTGSEWASFGAKGTWGASNGYYWAGLQTSPQVASFSASLGFIQNDTGIPSSMFMPLDQAPPVGTTDAALGLIANDFIIQGTVNPASQQLAGTPYTDYSTDPAQVDFIAPEPTGFVVVGGLFGLWAIGSATYRRMRKA